MHTFAFEELGAQYMNEIQDNIENSRIRIINKTTYIKRLSIALFWYIYHRISHKVYGYYIGGHIE